MARTIMNVTIEIMCQLKTLNWIILIIVISTDILDINCQQIAKQPPYGSLPQISL